VVDQQKKKWTTVRNNSKQVKIDLIKNYAGMITQRIKEIADITDNTDITDFIIDIIINETIQKIKQGKPLGKQESEKIQEIQTLLKKIYYDNLKKNSLRFCLILYYSFRVVEKIIDSWAKKNIKNIILVTDETIINENIFLLLRCFTDVPVKGG
jgi:hypothetical protein